MAWNILVFKQALKLKNEENHKERIKNIEFQHLWPILLEFTGAYVHTYSEDSETLSA